MLLACCNFSRFLSLLLQLNYSKVEGEMRKTLNLHHWSGVEIRFYFKKWPVLLAGWGKGVVHHHDIPNKGRCKIRIYDGLTVCKKCQGNGGSMTVADTARWEFDGSSLTLDYLLWGAPESKGPYKTPGSAIICSKRDSYSYDPREIG